MIKILLTFIVTITTVNIYAQNVGIGTAVPLARLHVSDSSVLFSAANDIGVGGNTPTSGQGRRMMWYPQKASFRAGYVAGNNWNTDSIGQYSFAAGYNTKAKGNRSVALGSATEATGTASFAAGLLTIAAGDGAVALGTNSYAIGTGSFSAGTFCEAIGLSSFAMGINNSALGDISMALGRQNITTGEHSIAIGYNTRSNGDASIALGQSTIANGNSSTATGLSTRAAGQYSFSAGTNTIAKTFAEVTIGQYNDSLTTNAAESTSWMTRSALLVAGNGTSSTARSNAWVLYKDGSQEMEMMTSTPLSIGNRLYNLN
jgi:hypothetical protein